MQRIVKTHKINAKGKVLGRLATQIASRLIGKDKDYFVPYLDCGDHVVVINAAGVRVTGKKEEQKQYEHFSGYPGGRKVKFFKDLIGNHSDRIIHEAVSGMLPKNKLRASMLKRLYVFPGETHSYKHKFES